MVHTSALVELLCIAPVSLPPSFTRRALDALVCVRVGVCIGDSPTMPLTLADFADARYKCLATSCELKKERISWAPPNARCPGSRDLIPICSDKFDSFSSWLDEEIDSSIIWIMRLSMMLYKRSTIRMIKKLQQASSKFYSWKSFFKLFKECLIKICYIKLKKFQEMGEYSNIY